MSSWFVASGGGSKGAPWHTGVLSALSKNGVEFEGFSGVSAGAIVSAACAMFESLEDAVPYIEKHVLTVETGDIWKRWFPFGSLHGLWKKSLRNSKPLFDLLESTIDDGMIRASGKQLRIGAVRITAKAGEGPQGSTKPGYEVFDETFSPMWKAVAASSAFPGFLLPVEMDGEWYVDGGPAVVTPIASAIRAGATEVHVSVSHPRSLRRPDNIGNALDVIVQTIETMMHRITWEDVKQTELWNRLVLEGSDAAGGKRHVKMFVYSPDEVLNKDSLEFVPEEAGAIFRSGFERAEEVLSG